MYNLREIKTKEKDFFEEAFFESYKVTYSIDPNISDKKAKAKQKEILGEKDSKIYIDDPNHKIIIIENEEGRKIGLIWISSKKNFQDYEKPIAWIYNIYIIPEFRRMGLAKKLVEKAENWAKKRELNTVALQVAEDNIISRELFEKMGFKILKQKRLKCYYEKEILKKIKKLYYKNDV